MTRYQRTHDEARIRAAIASMPYGGLERIGAASRKVGGDAHRPAPIQFGEIANYLEALRDLLVEITAEAREKEARLHELESDIAAVRRLLGSAGSAREPCCERDNDGDGNCAVHSAKGVLRRPR